jgi:uncharacterized protein YlzI (FlbEa/FlbD family)
MFIEVTKLHDTMAERSVSKGTLINADHIVSIDSQSEGSMIVLTDGSFIIVKEPPIVLISKINAR